MPDGAAEVLDQATLDELLDSLGGDAEFLAELIDTYVADAPEQVEAMRTALADADPEALVRPAHTLKSSSASLAALGLAERCRQLEASAKAGQLDGAASAVAEIADDVERVIAALEHAKQTAAP
jgi:histidine phosphotransfer protein HptB